MIDDGRPEAPRPADNENEEQAVPALSETDWDDIAAADLDADISTDNGDLRYEGEEPDGDLPEEDDDNPYQESDAALPDESEEKALARNPSHEGRRFDET